MDPVLLHKQLKQNTNDYDEFCKDLKNWGEDMKRKEESAKKITTNDGKFSANHKKRKNTSEKKLNSKNDDLKEKSKTKVGCTDYSAWEKFDVDAECEKIDYDENEESDLTDECDESLRDEAYVEKEKGNKFVKNEQWNEAIICYTKAIDCYSFDPIFYANRALCYLKLKNMQKAEEDCTTSLKLDKTYVKAYQRRAAAREALNKLEEAKIDLLEVLELEPKNKESRNALDKLEKRLNEKQKVTDTTQRPISKFTASRQQKRNISFASENTKTNIANDFNETKVHQQKQEVDFGKSCHWPSGEDNVILVKTVNKPIHLRSRKPLKRIEITETDGVMKEQKVESKHIEPYPKANESYTTLRTDDLKVVERKDPNRSNYEIMKETKNQDNTNKVGTEQVDLCIPKSSVQFYGQWKHLKTLENKYEYLKLIKAENLPQIFKESLESSVFSEFLEILAKCFINNNDKVFDYLVFLTKMKRFSALTMFMSDNDKNYVRKLIDYISAHEDQSKDEMDQLVKLYEL